MYRIAPAIITQLERKLSSYEVIERVKTDDQSVELITSIEQVKATKKEISGVLKFDRLLAIQHRGQIYRVPETVESPFVFDTRSEFRPFLIVLYHAQDEAVDKLNHILSPSREPVVVPSSIPVQEIHNFVENSAASIKYCSWKDVNIPHISKSALWGPDVARAKQDFQRYNTHGKINYVMIEMANTGWVIAISEEARVIFYTKTEEHEIVKFLEQSIEPLVS